MSVAKGNGQKRRRVAREPGAEVAEVRAFQSAVVADFAKMAADRGGRFIAVEGIDATRNASVAAQLAELLCRRGLEVILSGEPGGAPGADAITRLLTGSKGWQWSPVTQMLLHAAQRVDHLQRTVVPALNEGVWVVSAGYIGQSIATLGFGHGLGRDAIWRLHQQTTGGVMPDLTVVLMEDVDAPVGMTGGEPATADFTERVLHGFAMLADDPDVGAVPVFPDADPRMTAERITVLLAPFLT